MAEPRSNGPAKRQRAPRLSGPERRAQIITVARGVFVANGMSGARIRQIADAAGINEAGLYHYFSSKEEIFEAAVLEPLEALLHGLIEIARKLEAEGVERREMIARLHAYTLESVLDVTPLLGVALFSDTETGRDFYTNRFRPLIDEFTAAFHKGLGVFEHRDVDPAVLFKVVFGTYMAFALDVTFADETLDIDRTAADVSDLLYFGLAPNGSGPAAKKRGRTKR